MHEPPLRLPLLVDWITSDGSHLTVTCDERPFHMLLSKALLAFPVLFVPCICSKVMWDTSGLQVCWLLFAHTFLSSQSQCSNSNFLSYSDIHQRILHFRFLLYFHSSFIYAFHFITFFQRSFLLGLMLQTYLSPIMPSC